MLPFKEKKNCQHVYASKGNTMQEEASESHSVILLRDDLHDFTCNEGGDLTPQKRALSLAGGAGRSRWDTKLSAFCSSNLNLHFHARQPKLLPLYQATAP